jgi:hypothetical protein
MQEHTHKMKNFMEFNFAISRFLFEKKKYLELFVN